MVEFLIWRKKMSKVLSIDTTKSKAYINLNVDGKLHSSVLEDKVSESLLPQIELLLDNNNLTIKDIDVLGVVVGPGSFTGIRVGLSTIKGIAFVTNAKCIAINSFDVFNSIITNGVLLIKSTSTMMYYGKYEKNRLIDFGLVPNIDVTKKFSKCKLYQLEENNISDGCILLDNYSEYLDKAIELKCAEMCFVNAAAIEPLYVQLSQAENQLINKGAKI